MKVVIRNGLVLDTPSMSFIGERDVVIENELIVAIEENSKTTGDLEIDATGKYVLPGLIDGHVHFRLATLNFRKMLQWSEVEYGIVMAQLARESLSRGFTTVRDLGGDVTGLQRAIDSGLINGPRIVKAGLMISQTGGHGDTEGGDLEVPPCACSLRSNNFSIVADGPDAVRKAARHLLRDGSDFLKIHVSGGVASPTDPLEATQYTPDEVAAVVTEANHRGTYVAAHAYTPEAIAMAVRGGVKSIEHANLIDAETAKLVASEDAVVVPTLVTYKAMNDFGVAMGLPDTNVQKNKKVYESGQKSLEVMISAGVTLGYGTDLIGETQKMQNEEMAIRSEVQSASDILRSMWVVNAQLCRLEGKIGTVSAGAFGDVVVSSVNPLEDIRGFANYEQSLTHVVKSGVLVVEK